ncbi:HNH endonuclease [Desulfovibrio aminophilus]|nr:HNH endonuclease [Desulfovibrio aminophilus]
MIPIEIRKYFCADEMTHKDKKFIKLFYYHDEFDARIEMRVDSQESKGRTTIRWKSDLKNIINKKFKAYINDLKDEKMRPVIRFSKVKEDRYQIELITPRDIQKDSDNRAEKYNGSLDGNIVQYMGDRYTRDLANRKAAIELHGTKCKICNFDFEQVYGEHGSGFIEIHHLNPLADGERHVDPQKDLIPVCSNCHSMIHRQKEKYLTPTELKSMLKLSYFSKIVEKKTRESD